MAATPSSLPERAARNEDRFRKINEEIEPSNAAHAWFEPSSPDWVCECANEGCTQAVRLSVAEYESVRAEPTHFIIAPTSEHLVPGVERVVARHEGYWVVEKLGRAGALTEILDERTDD
jgi:hypothetical protein